MNVSGTKRSKGGLKKELSREQGEKCYLFTSTEDLPLRSLDIFSSLTESSQGQLLTFHHTLHLVALENPYR